MAPGVMQAMGTEHGHVAWSPGPIDPQLEKSLWKTQIAYHQGYILALGDVLSDIKGLSIPETDPNIIRLVSSIGRSLAEAQVSLNSCLLIHAENEEEVQE